MDQFGGTKLTLGILCKVIGMEPRKKWINVNQHSSTWINGKWIKVKLFGGRRPQCSLEISHTTEQLQLASVENHLATPICQAFILVFNRHNICLSQLIWVRSKKAIGLCLVEPSSCPVTKAVHHFQARLVYIAPEMPKVDPSKATLHQGVPIFSLDVYIINHQSNFVVKLLNSNCLWSYPLVI